METSPSASSPNTIFLIWIDISIPHQDWFKSLLNNNVNTRKTKTWIQNIVCKVLKVQALAYMDGLLNKPFKEMVHQQLEINSGVKYKSRFSTDAQISKPEFRKYFHGQSGICNFVKKMAKQCNVYLMTYLSLAEVAIRFGLNTATQLKFSFNFIDILSVGLQ